MMMKMLVPVAVLAAGLSMTTAKVSANPFADKAGLGRAAATSMVKEQATSMAKERATSMVKERAAKVATKTMTKATTRSAARTEETVSRTSTKTVQKAAKTTTVQKSAQKSGKTKKVAAAKGNRGDITGSIRKNESCSVKAVDLFDKQGNYAKTERMRVCL